MPHTKHLSSLILFVHVVLAYLPRSKTLQDPHTLRGCSRNIHFVISVSNSGDETRTQDVHKFSKNLGAISKFLAPEWHRKLFHTKGPLLSDLPTAVIWRFLLGAHIFVGMWWKYTVQLSYRGVVYLLYLSYFKMSCAYCCCLVSIVVVVLCVLLSSYVYLLYCVCIAVFTSDAWLLARSQDSEGPATGLLTQVFLGFPVPKSKCWDGSQHSKMPLHASHVALPT